ncbi:MAG: riboflavin biosynthesis protein RibF [Methylacidiphilales bacterium]|nr:riboflavin biosynthesis protein RibF [Candidatus Methylacidiphilales bacterium]
MFVCSLQKNNSHTSFQNAIITIGNYDGIHLGHQSLIRVLLQIAAEQNKVSLVLTFEPSIQQHFAKTKLIEVNPNNPNNLMSGQLNLGGLRRKFEVLKTMGVDFLAVASPKHSFISMSAENFISNILVERLAIDTILVGKDFHFGHKRLGTIATLQQQTKFKTIVFPDTCDSNQRISSTNIRTLINMGRITEATRLLGSPLSGYGRIVRGLGIGASLGFPTANIYSTNLQSWPMGVYIAKMHRNKNNIRTAHLCALSIGTRPTIAHAVGKVIEAHLLDYSGSLYGEWVHIEMLDKIRDQERYHTREALISAIAHDCALVRTWK